MIWDILERQVLVWHKAPHFENVPILGLYPTQCTYQALDTEIFLLGMSPPTPGALRLYTVSKLWIPRFSRPGGYCKWDSKVHHLQTVLNIALASSHGTCRTETFSRSNVGHKARGAFCGDQMDLVLLLYMSMTLFFPLG